MHKYSYFDLKPNQTKLIFKIIILVQILFKEPDYGISSKTRILDETICKNANKMDIAFLTLTVQTGFHNYS